MKQKFHVLMLSLTVVLLYITASFQSFAQSYLPGAKFQAADGRGDDIRSLLCLERMIQAHQLNDEQIEYSRFLFQEQTAMIDLFSKYGLLSSEQMKDKTREINEITKLQIFALLTDAQKAWWSECDLLLSSKPIRRHRLHVFAPAKD